jgi:hypothetical protein
VARSYAEVRPELRTGDVLCFRGRKLGSALIRWVTASRYSHVGLVYCFEGRVYCLEAVASGVRLIIMSELVRRYAGGIDYFAIPEANLQQREGAIGFAFEQLGKLYNRAGLARFIWFLWSGSRVRRRSRARNQWFCSEIVNEAYRRQGLPLVTVTSAYTSPEDIATSPRLVFRFRVKRWSSDGWSPSAASHRARVGRGSAPMLS